MIPFQNLDTVFLKDAMKNILMILCLTFMSRILTAQVWVSEPFDTLGRFPCGPTHYYDNGYFHAFSDKSYYFKDSSSVFSDFTCEVNTVYINGAVGEKYGIIFRASFDTVRYYEFAITADGHYSLYFRDDRGKDKSRTIFRTAKPDTTVQKNGMNHLKAHCVKDSIHLFINGKKVRSVKDKSLSAGYNGLIVNKDVHVHFDDYFVYQKSPKREPRPISGFMDSTYHFRPDSLTKSINNFSSDNFSWDNKPLCFYEKGYFRILKDNQHKYFDIFPGMENFVYWLNIRILKWDSAGTLTMGFHKGNYSHERQSLFFSRDSTVSYSNARNLQNQQPVLFKIPFEFDSGSVHRIKLEVQDSDAKLTVNDIERALIIDETLPEQVSGYFDVGVANVKMDILSYKINKSASFDYGLQASMPTCAVYRLSPPKETTFKPPVRKEKSKNPVVKFFKKLERDMDEWFWVTLVLLCITIIGLIIYIIIRIKRKRSFKNNFESLFLKRIALSNGSMKVDEIAGYFRLSVKKTLFYIDPIADKHHIVKHIIGNKDMIIEIPELMIVIPEQCDPVTKKISGLSNITTREAKEDFLTLIRIASVNHNQLTVDILRKEYHAQPNRIHFLRKNFTPEEPFEKTAKQLLYAMVDRNNFINESAGEDPVIQIKPDIVSAVIEFNK